MRLHLPKTLLAALLACFAALPEYASGAATIVTFGNENVVTDVTTDAMLIHNVGSAEKTLSDGSLISLVPSSGNLWSGARDGAITGTWSNGEALATMNTTLGLAENTIGKSYFGSGSDWYYTASGDGSSTSSLTLRLSGDVLIGSAITFFVTATARDASLGNFSASGLNGSSIAYAVNGGTTGFSDTASFSSGEGSITLIKYTGTVGVDRTVTFNSTTSKNGWQMLAYNVTSSPSYLAWNGTETSNEWNTSDTNWRDTSGQDSSFSEGAYVRFTSDAATNKTVVIDRAITAGPIEVLDDYTFSFGENGSLTSDGVSISAGKTLTKTGTGTWALGDKTVVGDLKVAEGCVTSSGIFNGNISVDGGDVTYTTTDDKAYNRFGGDVSIKNGALTINAATNTGDSIIKAGSSVNIGEAGKLVLKGHDLLGWSTGQAPKEIILKGSAGENAEDTPKYAVLDIQDSGNNGFTFAAPLKLNGYTKVTGTEFNTNGSAITISAVGADNTIRNTIAVNNTLTVDVADQGSLTFAGGLKTYNDSTGKVIEKTNSGTLIISGEGIDYKGVINVNGGTLETSSEMSVSALSVTNGSTLNTSKDIRITTLSVAGASEVNASAGMNVTTLSVAGASTVNASADISVSKVSVTGGSNLTVGAGKTTTITSSATAGGLVLNAEGTSKVILKGQSETVEAGGKLVYDDFTYQASGATDAEIIGNKDTAFKLWDSFGSISNATVSLNSNASGDKTIGNGGVGTLNNVTLSNNSTHNLTVLSTATGKLSIINNDGGASASGTGTIIDKTIKNTVTTRAEGDSSTPSFSSYDRVEAVTGNVEIYKVGTQVNVADMVIGSGRTISVYQGDDDTSTKSTVLLGGLATDMTTLTAGSGSTLKANLLTYNTELTLSGALTLNGSLEMYSMKLMATDYMHWNNIGKDGVLTLFNGVTGVTGFTDGADASTVFTNLGTGDFTLKYNAAGGIVQMVANRAVPEPTTATLSLLALAGLMARRRRRRA